MPRVATKLECERTEVTPGRALRCQLSVYNPADRVNEITVVAHGPLAPFTTVSPEVLALLPGSEGVLTIDVDLPADASVRAGPQQLLLRAASGLADVEPSLEEVSVEVSEVTRADLTLRARSPAEPTYEAVLANASNHPVSFEMSAEADADTMVDPRVVVLEAFGHGSSLVTLEPDEAETGRPVELTVRASGDGLELEASTTWNRSPGRSSAETWRRRIAIGVVALVAAGGAAFAAGRALDSGPDLFSSGVVVLRSGSALDLDGGLAQEESGPRSDLRNRGVDLPRFLERFNAQLLVDAGSTEPSGACVGENRDTVEISEARVGDWLCVRTDQGRTSHVQILFVSGDAIRMDHSTFE